MSALVSSELLKLRSTRSAAGTALGLLAFIVLLLVIDFATASAEGLADPERQRQIVALGSVAMIFAALVGILSVTSEFRHGTITPTLLAAPRRAHVLAAKLAAAGVVGALLAAAAYAVAVVGLTVGLRAHGVDGVLGAGDLAVVAVGTLAASALWAGLGVGLGALVQSQVVAIVGFLLWLLVAESLISGLAPAAGRYLPGQAGDALVGSIGEAFADRPLAAALLVGYAAAFAVVGALRLRREDVT